MTSHLPVKADEIKVISPSPYAPLKAEVINDSLINYTLDVEFFTNMSTDKDAKFFAIYTSETLPQYCGNFKDIKNIPFKRIGEYKQRFDLKGHSDIVKSLRRYDCVVVYNMVKY